MQALVAAGHDVTYANSGYTALHLAAYDGNRPMIRLLVRFGADMNARSGHG